MQQAQTDEIDAEEAPEAELEGGVDDEAQRTRYDLNDGIFLMCDSLMLLGTRSHWTEA